MTKETFQKIILKTELVHRKAYELYKLGIDLTTHEEDYLIIIDELMREAFNEEQLGWIDWYLYERESLTRKGKPNKAWKTVGKKKVEICYDIDSLWETVCESGQQADFDNRLGG